MILTKTLKRKLDLLNTILESYGNMVLALSGGKDSSLILYTGVEVLGSRNVFAVTAVSPIRRDSERELAIALCQRLRVRHELVHTKEYRRPEFIRSHKKRCFICKKELFEHLRRVSNWAGFKNLVDGTNLDDYEEARRVFKIAKRYGIKWPLVEAKIRTPDVESLLEYVGLEEYIQPHYSCSASEMDLRTLL